MAADIHSECARLWRKILNTDPVKIFGPRDVSALLRRHPYDRLAQPGYVGADYRGRGLVFVAQRPGAGDDGLGEADMTQYPLLERVRDSSDTISAYERLMATLADIMLGWKIVQNCQIERILSSKGMRFTEIAFVNLIAWRTQSSAIPASAYEAAWDSQVREQLSTLDPGRVIALGVPARNWLKKGGIETFEPADTIKRRQADRGLLVEGEKVVEAICIDGWRPENLPQVSSKRPD